MPRPKQPLARARVTGADVHDPQRFRDRKEPTGSAPLGAPSSWLSDAREAIWREFVDQVPWLRESDRSTVELVVVLTERLHDDTITVSEIGQLRLLLGQCGATPASRSGISVEDDEDEDPSAEFIQ